MKELLAKVIIPIIPRGIRFRIERPWRSQLSMQNEAYSQNGEDLVLARLFHGTKHGFFVDVGAHHPFRFSNTYRLYKDGWRGLNIDAMPGSMKAFNELRPNDINVEAGVSITQGTAKYYVFNEPALNTFSKEEAEKKNGRHGFQIQQVMDVPTYPLRSLLEKHLPENQTIDYLNVDIEGFDLQALQSNDWERFPVRVVSVESYTKGGITSDEVYKYMKGLGYHLTAVVYNTLIFVHEHAGTDSTICI